jgi:hypothetical protein
MSKKKKIIFSITLLLLIVFAYWFKGQLDIDKCLDRGGRWNYEKGICGWSPATSPRP